MRSAEFSVFAVVFHVSVVEPDRRYRVWRIPAIQLPKIKIGIMSASPSLADLVDFAAVHGKIQLGNNGHYEKCVTKIDGPE